jgi:hypothetical protein
MGQVEPQVPPASQEVSSLTSSISGMISVILGSVAAVFGFVGVLTADGTGRLAALLVIGAGICFALAGIAVSRRAAEGWALMSMICGILLGVGSRFVN